MPAPKLKLDRSRSGIFLLNRLSPSVEPQPRWAANVLARLFFNRLQYNKMKIDTRRMKIDSPGVKTEQGCFQMDRFMIHFTAVRLCCGLYP
jgi:hypothetical protein